MEGLGDMLIGDPCSGQRALLDGGERSGRYGLAECAFEQAHENRTLRRRGVSREDFGAGQLEDCGAIAFYRQLDAGCGRVAEEADDSLGMGRKAEFRERIRSDELQKILS